MGSPKVSIITPAYNVAPYIGQAIESVQAQTLADWEMIIVDDASTDETATVVKRYRDDSRIKFLQNAQNMGAGYTRNRALDVATGAWIAVLDADDWYAPHRLERLLAFAEDWGADVVGDLMICTDRCGKTMRLRSWATREPVPVQPFRVFPERAIRAHAAFQYLARAEFIRQKQVRYVPEIRKSQDTAFLLEMLIKGAECAVLPEALYYYRLYPNTITSRYAGDYTHNVRTYEYLARLPEATPLQQRLLRREARRSKVVMLHRKFKEALSRRDWRTAWATLVEEPSVLLFGANRKLKALQERRRGVSKPLSDPRRQG
ncbi:MAG: glycosyltransferase family 2 protein [Candidatus Caldarchaeum sp.]